MVHLPTQDGRDGEGIHLVLYDGVCGLCSRLLRFAIRHDRRCVFRFASLRSLEPFFPTISYGHFMRAHYHCERTVRSPEKLVLATHAARGRHLNTKRRNGSGKNYDLHELKVPVDELW